MLLIWGLGLKTDTRPDFWSMFIEYIRFFSNWGLFKKENWRAKYIFLRLLGDLILRNRSLVVWTGIDLISLICINFSSFVWFTIVLRGLNCFGRIVSVLTLLSIKENHRLTIPLVVAFSWVSSLNWVSFNDTPSSYKRYAVWMNLQSPRPLSLILYGLGCWLAFKIKSCLSPKTKTGWELVTEV